MSRRRNPKHDRRRKTWSALIQGRVRRGEKAEAVVLDAETGEVKWTRDDYPWLTLTTRTVLAKGMLVFEVSTLNDHDAGNGIHVVSADYGRAPVVERVSAGDESCSASPGDVLGRRSSGFCTAAKSTPATKKTRQRIPPRFRHSIR